MAEAKKAVEKKEKKKSKAEKYSSKGEKLERKGNFCPKCGCSLSLSCSI
jgi:hypothetical protein